LTTGSGMMDASPESRIAALQSELAAVRAEMQDFTAAVSHDLRAPLRHIVSYVQLVQEDAGPQLEPEVLDFLATISDSARHMGVLLDGLTTLSHIGLALTDFAKQKKVFFLAGEPLTDKIVWQNGNRYTYRLRPSTYMQVAMMVPEAAALKKKRWALVFPNYEYGQSAVAAFKQLLKAAQPDVEFVAEQATPLGRVDAGSVVQALSDAKPDAVFNVLFGADLSKFVREGNTRGLFKGIEVVSVLTGEPEYMDPLKDEAPNGWIVTGYPWYGIQTPEHKAFQTAYQAKFNDYPRLGSIVGYSAIKSLAEGMKKAGSTDTEKLVAAFKGLQVPTPFGRITYRPEDNQSTMGGYVGRTKNEGGKGVMVDYRYLDGAKFQPSADEVKKMRPAD